MKSKGIIKKTVQWLIRDEISVRQKFLNVALSSVLLVMVPCIIFTGIIYRNLFSISLPIAGILTVGIGLWCANNEKRYKIWSQGVLTVICFIILPICYFWDGGKETSDDIWFMAGLIMIFVLMEGWQMWIMAFLDSALISICFLIEYRHPEWVHHMGTPESRIAEIVISMILIGTVLGLIFTFQSYLYEKQAKLLLEKEEHLKEAMEALEKANNAKSEFLANMSHEIRTPINAVLGMNEMILRESKEDKILEYAINVDNAGHNLLSLVNDILDFTKIDSGKMDILSFDYELFSLLKDCYNLVARRAKEKKLDFSIINNPSLPTVLKGDEIRVRQVITNLLTNAVKYTSSGSVYMKVDYKMTGEDTMDLFVQVIDTGIGIKDGEQDKLFEKFERSESYKNRNIEGTGLGLAITKNLLDLMGGSISVESEYGNGSAFTVSIPQIVVDPSFIGNLTDRFEITEETREAYCESFKAPAARILTVDDVKINNDVICSLLKQTEVIIDCAYSGRECLNCLRNNTYDLVLMDHMMPEMDGIETLRRLRAMEDSPNKDVPVVILTANAIVGAREEYINMGFNDYISKPVEAMELERIVANHLPVKLVHSINKNDFSIEKFSYLDVAYGIHYCADSEELYRQGLENFVDKDNKLEAINNAFKNKNWDEYELVVHSIKHLLLLVGDRNLSEIAKGLEFAIKDKRMDTVELNHEAFVQEYEKLIEKIKKDLYED